jgi:hypothetical protein
LQATCDAWAAESSAALGTVLPDAVEYVAGHA